MPLNSSTRSLLGISDYSGGTVYQWPTREAVVALVQPRTDGKLVLCSSSSVDSPKPILTLQMRDFIAAVSVSHAAAREYLSSISGTGDHWPCYVAGFLLRIGSPILSLSLNSFLSRAISILDLHSSVPSGGLSIALFSTLPQSKGVASSAAAEVASALALAAYLRVHATTMKLALLCQHVEHKIVGAPCGIMDQLSCMFGRSGTLLKLKCQVVFLLRVPYPLAYYL